MPVRNHPLTIQNRGERFLRPYLSVRAFCSETHHGREGYLQKGQLIMGLVDTGADTCAMPLSYASLIGHVVENGETGSVITAGSGDIKTVIHTCSFDLLCPRTKRTLYHLENIKTHFTNNLKCPLIGVSGFLNQFMLTIDYPSNCFSLKKKGYGER